MRILHIDAFAGISGDMTVSALRDLGVPEEVFQNALASLGIDLPACRFERGERNGIAGWRFRVNGHDGGEGASNDHHHHDQGDGHSHGAHDHGHTHDGAPNGHTHPHTHEPSASVSRASTGHFHEHSHGRNHAEIVALLKASSLIPEVKRRALSIFQRIAIAEGGIHGVPPDTVDFHEVGAEDSIADIVAACAGFESLGINAVSCGQLQEGTGHIHCAHGTFPLPAPATLALLKGIPFRQVEEPWEHITPTGAAILAEYATNFGPMPEMSVSMIGYGLGSRHIRNRPNALRFILGELVQTGHSMNGESDGIVELRSNLDDLSPELASSVLDALLSAGALDVTLTPTVMKKGRSGWILEVLSLPGDAERLSESVLRLTTAFGVRRHRMERLKLERHHRGVETRYGAVQVKIGMLNGEILQQSPEFSSCAEMAAQQGVPVRLVYQEALKNLS